MAEPTPQQPVGEGLGSLLSLIASPSGGPAIAGHLAGTLQVAFRVIEQLIDLIRIEQVHTADTQARIAKLETFLEKERAESKAAILKMTEAAMKMRSELALTNHRIDFELVDEDAFPIIREIYDLARSVGLDPRAEKKPVGHWLRLIEGRILLLRRKAGEDPVTANGVDLHANPAPVEEPAAPRPPEV